MIPYRERIDAAVDEIEETATAYSRRSQEAGRRGNHPLALKFAARAMGLSEAAGIIRRARDRRAVDEYYGDGERPALHLVEDETDAS